MSTTTNATYRFAQCVGALKLRSSLRLQAWHWSSPLTFCSIKQRGHRVKAENIFTFFLRSSPSSKSMLDVARGWFPMISRLNLKESVR